MKPKNLLTAIDMNNLHQYSNIDVSTIDFTGYAADALVNLDYDRFTTFIDIFDDVNKLEGSSDFTNVLTFGDIVIYSIYNKQRAQYLTDDEQIKLLFKLFQRGFTQSIFVKESKCYDYSLNYNRFTKTMNYIKSYSNAITNLFKLTNSNNINIHNLNDKLIDTIKMILLISKTRIVPQGVAPKSLPKYVLLHKVLYFYLY